jgi:hypothetical protein
MRVSPERVGDQSVTDLQTAEMADPGASGPGAVSLIGSNRILALDSVRSAASFATILPDMNGVDDFTRKDSCAEP